MKEIINYLKQADIFYQLTTSQLEMIANIGVETSHGEKELILEEGSQSKELYVIIHGEVDVLVNPALVGGPSAPKNEVIIATMRRGQSFGEMALVDEGMRSATVRAGKKGVRLLIVSREKLLLLCETYPQLGYRLMYNLAADLAMKVRNTDLRVREGLLHLYGSNK